MKTHIGEMLKGRMADAFPVNARRNLRQGHAVANQQDDIFGPIGKFNLLIINALLARRGTGGNNYQQRQQKAELHRYAWVCAQRTRRLAGLRWWR